MSFSIGKRPRSANVKKRLPLRPTVQEREACGLKFHTWAVQPANDVLAGAAIRDTGERHKTGQSGVIGLALQSIEVVGAEARRSPNT